MILIPGDDNSLFGLDNPNQNKVQIKKNFYDLQMTKIQFGFFGHINIPMNLQINIIHGIKSIII
jgi:hypothetical protein